MQRIIPTVIGLLIALFILMSCVFVVDQRQFAVVYALGEIRKVIDAPGLYFKLPPPFQNVVYYDKRILTIDTSDSDRFITSEKLNVMIDTFVKWRIVDPPTFIRSVAGSEQIAVDRINRSLRDALNNEIARRTVSDMISGARIQVVESVRSKINEDSRQIGVEIVDVRLKRVDFAPEVSERVFARMESERKQVANERRATGSAESEKIRADADRQKTILLAEARKQADILRGEGDGIRNRVYAEAFQQDPEFFGFYRTMQAYRSSLGEANTSMVLSPDSEFFRYFGTEGLPSARGNGSSPGQ